MTDEQKQQIIALRREGMAGLRRGSRFPSTR